MEEKQASMVLDMREMMVELMSNNCPSESSSTEDSAAVWGRPQGAEPTAVRENSADDSASVRGCPRGAESTTARQKICCCCCCWRLSARRHDSGKRDHFL